MPEDRDGNEEEKASRQAEEGEFALEMPPEKEAKYQQIIYGTKVDYISGYEIDGYEAVSRGVFRTMPTQQLATLLFRADRGAVPHVLGAVPQKIMCNCLFVIDLKKLPAETDIYFDGLGTWDQNCGKITNYFRYIDGGAVDARGEDDATMFIRRTDRNVNCKSYTRIIVICKDFGLAAVQYYFKNAEEQPFEIAHANVKGVRASAMYSVSKLSKILTGKRKTMSDVEDDDSNTGDEQGTPQGKGNALLRQNIQPRLYTNRLPPSSPPYTDVTPGYLISYLKSHIAEERSERAQERKLRREELEARRKEMDEERQLRKEELEARIREGTQEMEIRKQELSLERSKVAMEQQRWELDRKEKEAFLELLRKKLLKDD